MVENEDAFDGISIIAPPKRKINFVGEIVEISFVPARTDIEFHRIISECNAEKMDDYTGFNAVADLVLSICTSNPAITKDWLIDNTSFDMMIDFFAAAKGKTPKKAGESSGKKSPLGKSLSK